jgi:hypothetical protein
MKHLSRASICLGLLAMLGAVGCGGSNRDALYTQLPTPDDARAVERDPHLIDDHGDVQVHTSRNADPLVDPRDKIGDVSADADEATAKLRDR